MLQHDALLADVSECTPEPGAIAFWWMGQHSFILRVGAHVVYIDPYLTPNDARRTPPLLRPDEVTNADFVLCTHDHGDHIDPGAVPGIAAASPTAIFVAPRTARQRMLDLDVDEARLVSLDADDAYVTDGLRVTAVKGKHEFFDHDEALGYPYLGYVIEAGDATIYHAGDTIAYDGLIATLAKWDIDLAFLPINGRDARRLKANCLGNFTFQEAVDVAGDIQARHAVPTHYEMFEFNSADPQDFVDYLAAKFPDISTWVGDPGTRVVVRPAH